MSSLSCQVGEGGGSFVEIGHAGGWVFERGGRETGFERGEKERTSKRHLTSSFFEAKGRKKGYTGRRHISAEITGAA